ncbi:hypothetical protein [Parasitella parasitica]|uniref:Uncharacterized protein n=1 Tax=Parasitella parasitica TaxID=35722 RepID=A0A0B7MYN5_9FUNG|nr:hypothetical protein [Parasitella parasitica]
MKKTFKKDNVIDRIAVTEKELNTTYNSGQCSAKFEIFDIFSDIDVVIGMDLIMQISITTSNMAMDWDDNNDTKISSIDPNPFTVDVTNSNMRFRKQLDDYTCGLIIGRYLAKQNITQNSREMDIPK